MRSSTPSSGPAVVDAPGPGLGHAVGGDHCRAPGPPAGRPRRAARRGSPTCRSARGRWRRARRGWRPEPGLFLHGPRVEVVEDGAGRARHQRAGHHREPADVGEGQAGHPPVHVGVDRQRRPRWPGPTPRPRRGCGPPPWARRWSRWWPPPSASPGSVAHPAGEGGRTLGGDHPGRSERVRAAGRRPAGGRRGSTGSPASPSSQTSRRASTKPGPAGRSSATNSPMRVA